LKNLEEEERNYKEKLGGEER